MMWRTQRCLGWRRRSRTAKKARILESTEYKALRQENEALKTELKLYTTACLDEPTEGSLASVLGWLPF